MKQAILLALLLVNPGTSIVLDKKLIQIRKDDPNNCIISKPVTKDDSHLIETKKKIPGH